MATQKSLQPYTLDESSLSIWRVNLPEATKILIKNTTFLDPYPVRRRDMWIPWRGCRYHWHSWSDWPCSRHQSRTDRLDIPDTRPPWQRYSSHRDIAKKISTTDDHWNKKRFRVLIVHERTQYCMYEETFLKIMFWKYAKFYWTIHKYLTHLICVHPYFVALWNITSYKFILF